MYARMYRPIGHSLGCSARCRADHKSRHLPSNSTLPANCAAFQRVLGVFAIGAKSNVTELQQLLSSPLHLLFIDWLTVSSLGNLSQLLSLAYRVEMEQRRPRHGQSWLVSPYDNGFRRRLIVLVIEERVNRVTRVKCFQPWRSQ